MCQAILFEAVRGASKEPVGGGELIGLGWLSGSAVTVPEESGRVRCDAGHAGFSVVLALSSRAHLLPSLW